jgi:opacity protein-like surface antigen
MKRIAFALTIALFLLARQNLLAGPERIDTKDSKVTTQPVVEKECRWTGFYIGAHGGYSWGESSFLELNETDPPYLFDHDGFFGGGQAGFNLQLGSFFVLGVEGTFAGGDFGDTADIVTTGNERSRGDIDSSWIATVGGRVGITFCKNRLLVYGKGGAAFTQFDYHTKEVAGTEVFDADNDRVAALLGGGLEYALTCHWSVKLEYNHLFFGCEDVTGIEKSGGGAGVNRTFRSDISDRDSVTAGINFKF